MTHEHSGASDSFGAGLRAEPSVSGSVGVKGRWGILCRDPDGNPKWFAPIDNEVMNDGRKELLTAALLGQARSTSWFVGVLNGTTSSTDFQRTDTADSTTLAWTESTNYTEANLPQWNGSTVGIATVSSTANKATFSVDTNGSTFTGAFLVDANTKGVTGTSNASSGTILYAAGLFTVGKKNADNGDTLEVAGTFSTTG